MLWKERMEDSLFVPQRQAILAWLLMEGNLRPDERVIFFLDEEERFRLEEMVWKKESWVAPVSHLAFLIVLPGNFDRALPKLSQEGVRDDWYLLYRSTTLEVWENRTRHAGKILPLRFGLSDDEKLAVLGEVRRMLGETLNGQEPVLPTALGERFEEKQTLDIAVWVDGHLRASMIEIGKPCTLALTQAAKRVPHDARFESLLTLEELPRARIEMTFMGDLEIPLTQPEQALGVIDPTKGYVVRSHGRMGWYLPEVHNAIQFKHLGEMCAHLAREKAKIDPQAVHYREYRTFAVSDWVETGTGLLSLSGPMPEVSVGSFADDNMLRIGERIIAQFKMIETADGNIPAILHPKIGVKKATDWVRLACASHALFCYGKATRTAQALQLARAAAGAMDRELHTGSLPKRDEWLFMVYRLRFRLAAGEGITKSELEGVVQELSQYRGETIAYLQGLSLLLDAKGAEIWQDENFLYREIEHMYREFEEKRDLPTTQLASYPELYAILSLLWRTTGEKKWHVKLQAMGWWYRDHQLPDGSFPSTPGRPFSYTRGTGKILEALACEPEANQLVLERGWYWLETMQYTADNTFFIPIEHRQLFIGGFRHDAFNQDVWIDAAGHVLLGVARLLERKAQ